VKINKSKERLEESAYSTKKNKNKKKVKTGSNSSQNAQGHKFT